MTDTVFGLVASVCVVACIAALVIDATSEADHRAQCSKRGLALAADEVTCFDPSTRCVLDATDGPYPLCRKARP